ncbi:MAG TPA: choice-of-anchor Q domain-containing protein [Leadbetterella sp.]|nr:choice-of-anchor Q domain-containing protein [Leadbetterella sp.]
MKKNFYLLLIVFIGLGHASMAQTKTWIGGTVGNLTSWHEPNNWSPSGVPTATDAVLLNSNTTNDPIISSAAFAKSIDISNGGCPLTVQSTGSLTLSNVGNPINISQGSITNNGTITATNTRASQPGNEGALRMTNGNFYQYGTLELIGGNTYGISISGAAPSEITCYSGSNTTISGTDGLRFTSTTAFIDMRDGSVMNITGTTRGAFLNPGKVQVAGKLTVNGNVEHTGLDGLFQTSNCGSITINGNLSMNNQSVITNPGSFVVTGNLNTGNGFTNNGVVKYGTTSGNAINNRRALVFDTNSPTGVFTISTLAGNTTNIGVFSDAAATVSAGTYTAGTNRFDILSSYAEGTYPLYAKMTQITCNYIVPFNFTKVIIRRYVKPIATGTGDGSSWTNASADLQAMLNASGANDEVWVAAGVYKPQKDGAGNASPSNVQNKVFWLKSGVKLYGGFAGTETSISQRVVSANKTILSGDIDNNDVNIDGNNIAELSSDRVGTNTYQLLVLVNCDKSTVVDGLILTAAAGSSTTGTPPGQTINGSTIFPYFGSAIHLSSSYPTIKNSVFAGNGGTYGALYHNNSIYTDTVKVFNSIFTGNSAQITGGIFMHRGNSYLNNVAMFNNSATSNGAAFVVSNNMANSGQIVVVNSTFVNNYGSISGKSIGITGGTNKLHNVIVYNSTPYAGGSVLISSPGIISSSNSLLQNSKNAGVWNNGYGTDGGGNIDLNPNFLNLPSPVGADGSYFTSDDGLALTNCSPALNTGSNVIPATGGLLLADIIGNVRPFNSGAVDIGAYEFQGVSVVPPDPIDAAASSNTIVCGQSITLSATCSVGTVTWYAESSGGASLGTGTSFSVSPLVSSVTYYAACESSSTCVSINRIGTGNITVNLPTDPTNVTVSNTAICPNTMVSLNASCTTGIPEWYNGASALSTTTPFTPTVTTNTTYSVRCKNGTCLSNPVNVPQIIVLSTPTGITTSIRNICGNTIPAITFTATCAVGTVRWYDASTGGSLVGTGSPFVNTPISPTPGFNRYYPSCSNGTCESNRVPGESFVYTPVPNNAVASPNAICTPSNVTFSATCSNGSINWYTTPTGGSSVSTASSFIQSVSSTTTYYAECTNNFLSVCFTDRVAVTATFETAPTSPTGVLANKNLVCPNGSVSLSATCASGTVKWYNASSGGTLLGSGSPLVQNPTTSTTYYAACESGSCTPSTRVATAQVVVGNIQNTLTLTSTVTGTQSFLAAQNINAGNVINAPANIKYLASNFVQLNPGFSVGSGSVFESKIESIQACP